MKITYSTNAWGSVMAHNGSANNVNLAYYIATGDDEVAIKEISDAGFESIEMFDGNLLKYENNEQILQDILNKYNVVLKGVYSAANFIYDEILEEEIYKIKRTSIIAKKLGADHLIIGGGAIRYDGIRETDYSKLARALDRVVDIARNMGMTASFHPHMGSLVESPAQLDKVMSLSEIFLCPDCGHLYLGGGDPLNILKKYIDRIKYFHLKGVTKEGVFCSLDKGMIDFNPIMDYLMKNRKEIDLAVECDANNKHPLADAIATAGYLSKWIKK